MESIYFSITKAKAFQQELLLLRQGVGGLGGRGGALGRGGRGGRHWLLAQLLQQVQGPVHAHLQVVAQVHQLGPDCANLGSKQGLGAGSEFNNKKS